MTQAFSTLILAALLALSYGMPARAVATEEGIICVIEEDSFDPDSPGEILARMPNHPFTERKALAIPPYPYDTEAWEKKLCALNPVCDVIIIESDAFGNEHRITCHPPQPPPARRPRIEDYA